jgi:hypothetical protein
LILFFAYYLFVFPKLLRIPWPNVAITWVDELMIVGVSLNNRLGDNAVSANEFCCLFYQYPNSFNGTTPLT